MNYFEDVIDVGLIPKRPYVKRTKTNLLLLHHVEGTMTVQAIHEMHMNDPQKNYAGIAYNLYIDKDGKRYWGRGPDYAGGSVKSSGVTRGMNERAFAIVCNGNFNKEQMSKAQKDALFKSAAEVCMKYEFQTIGWIKGHREVDSTDCPGAFFPLDELREYIRTYKPVEPTPKNPLLWKVIVPELNLRAGPSTRYKILKVLKHDDVVLLSRYVKREKWARVLHDGIEGWVWLNYIGER